VEPYGLTVPLGGPLHAQRELIASLPGLGYTDVWSAEAGGADAFTPLALASAWAPTLRLGTAIVPAFTRAPATIAQCAGALADAAPGRVAIGIGSSSDIIVRRWNGLDFDRPYERVRDVVRFLRVALTGERVTREYPTFTVDGFRLLQVPEIAPKLLVAALRPGMLRLAGRESDGAIVNWLSADDVRTVAPYVHEGGADREVVARIFVAPSADPAVARAAGRAAIAAYLTVPVYRAFHEWLGRTEVLDEMWRAWSAGDRRGAAAAIPDEVVDALVVHGTPEQMREHIGRYVEAGVTTPVLALLPLGGAERHGHVGGDIPDHVRALAPSRSA
jgi:probable F420-dependent oxidoreductase